MRRRTRAGHFAESVDVELLARVLGVSIDVYHHAGSGAVQRIGFGGGQVEGKWADRKIILLQETNHYQLIVPALHRPAHC
jgi:hypothetical protein